MLPRTDTSSGLDLSTFPSTDRMLARIAYLSGLGHRKTGTPQGRQSAEYIADAFRGAGLSPVTIERAPTPCPTVHTQSLAFDGRSIECFWVNGTGRQAPLGRFRSEIAAGTEIVYLGAGWESDFDQVDVAGKVVVCDIYFHPSLTSTFLDINPRAEFFDPDDSLFEPRNKFDIYAPNNWPNNYFKAQQLGAAGFVGALQNYMDCYNYNEDYTDNGKALGVDGMEIPAVWVSRSDGAEMARTIEAAVSFSDLSLTVDVEYEMKDALNVVGVLPGLSAETILVHSHHDAVFAGAVQDASGIAEVIALAEFFGGLPIEDRGKTMMFAATDTHFTDYVGHEAFLGAREQAGDDIVLDLCIEHIGKEVELTQDNHAVETGLVEPRIVYVADESGLLEVVKEAFAKHRLSRTIFAPVSVPPEGAAVEPYEFRPDEVMTDAYAFAEAGIPVVSLIGCQMYLFHPSDTIERIAVDQLRPVGMAFAEIAAAAHALGPQEARDPRDRSSPATTGTHHPPTLTHPEGGQS